MENVDDKIKEYKVKVPVYISDNVENEETLFGSTYSNMIKQTRELIDQYNNDPLWHVTSDKRAKTSVTGVNRIDYEDCKIGDDSCLLIQVTAYKTNLVDGYYEGENNDVIVFKENDKLCSDTHFLLLYPNIYPKTDKSNVVYWRVFVYEDPTKTNDEVTRVAKLIMKEIIKCPVRNIKEEKLLSDLRSEKIIEGIEIKFMSLTDDDEITPPYLKLYNFESKLKKERKISLENVSCADAVKIYQNIDLPNDYNKKQIQFLFKNKRVLTVTQEFYENMKQTFDDSFNYSFIITEEDLKGGKLFEKDFIIEQMQSVINSFMSLNGNIN